MGSFFLWQPTVDKNLMACHFDIYSDDFGQMKNGTKELIDEFLQVIQIQGEVVDWQITSFCSPYYGQVNSSNWRDKYRKAWRVEIQFKTSCVQKSPILFTPYPIQNYDSTWEETEEALDNALNWREKRCIIIADFSHASNEEVELFLQDSFFTQLLVGTEIIQLTPDFIQLRCDLGIQKFPESSFKIDQFVAQCQQKAFSTHYAKTLLEWQKRKESKKQEESIKQFAEELKNLGLSQ